MILAALFHRFDLRFAHEIDDASMELDEFWLANPVGQHLDIIATERR